MWKILQRKLTYWHVRQYKVSNIALSPILVKSDPEINQVIKQVNWLLQVLRKINNFYFICNNAIDNTFYGKMGVILHAKLYLSFPIIFLNI